MSKNLILNACYSDQSLQARLSKLYATELLEKLTAMAEATDAEPIVAVYQDSDAFTSFSEAAAGLPVEIVKAERIEILSEPSALCNYLNGLPAMSSKQFNFRGAPVMVVNPVYLLDESRIYFLMINGDAAYPVGPESTWREVADEFGEGIRALVVGRLSSQLITAEQFDEQVDEKIFLDPLFDGIVSAVTEKDCPVCLLEKLSEESKLGACGKCVYCRLGTKQVGLIAKAVSEAESNIEELQNITYIADGMSEAASCEYGRRFGRFIHAYMTAFGEDFMMHIRRKKCVNLKCRGYITYHVLPDICQGCGECSRNCPNNAIMGDPGEIHVIVKEDCSRCGDCMTACPNQAVTVAGILKPKTPKYPIPVGTWKR